MIEELLRRFARENFDDANYVPFLYGHLGTANPLSLIIKRKRSIWKRPLAKAEIIFLGGLEKFISSDSEKDYLEAIKLIVPEKVMEKGRNDPVDRYKDFINHSWAASCEKVPDDIFCPFLVLSFFAHFIHQIT